MRQDDIVKIYPSPEMIQEAREQYTRREFNRHTIRKAGKGQLVGVIAELAFKSWLDSMFFEYEYVATDMLAYDFVIGIRTMDVKAKRRTVPYDSEHQTHVETRLRDCADLRPCDYYMFASVVVPKQSMVPSCIELIGYMSFSEYWTHPDIEHVTAGEKGSDGFTELADASKLNHRHLRSMRELRDRIELHLYKKAFGEVS